MEKILRDKKAIIIFIAPAALLFAALSLYPILYAVYISFCEWSGSAPPEFVGLKSYKYLFTKDKIMMTAIKNSIFFTLFSLITQQIIGIFIAVVLSNLKKGRNLFKNVYYLPNVLSSAAVGLLFGFLLHPTMGINNVIELTGIKGPLWLSDIDGFLPLPMWSIGMVATWQYMGATMMLYLAGIAGIPSTLYEASYIDGATKMQTFRRITLPLLRPMMKTTISLTCIGSLKFFDLIYTMTEGGPANRTQVLATHVYTQGFKYTKYGYASTISMVLLVFCLLVTVIVNKGIRVEDYEM